MLLLLGENGQGALNNVQLLLLFERWFRRLLRVLTAIGLERVLLGGALQTVRPHTRDDRESHSEDALELLPDLRVGVRCH